MLFKKMNSFDKKYLKIKRLLTEGLIGRSGIQPLLFRFYDRFGELRYVLPFKTASGSTYVPSSPHRLTDEFLESPQANEYDKRNRNFIQGGITFSLESFFEQRDRYETRTRDEIRKESPSRVRNVVDKEFDYSVFELICKDTVYAWGKKGSNDYHIGEDITGVNMKAPLYGKKQEADRSETPGVASNYTLHIKDDSGKETYVLPFTPTGEYSFKNTTWKIIDNKPINDLKNVKNPENSGLKKWLNDMIWKTLDQMLTISNNLPPTPASATYPLTQIDGDFDYASFELWKDDKRLLRGSKNVNFIKLG